MHVWQEEYLHTSIQNVSKEGLFSLLLKQANDFGFEYCSYAIYQRNQADHAV